MKPQPPYPQAKSPAVSSSPTRIPLEIPTETASDFLTELKESQIQSLKVEEDQTETNSWWYSILAVGALS